VISLLFSLVLLQGEGGPPATQTIAIHLTGIVREQDPEETPFSGTVDSFEFYASETGGAAIACGTFDRPRVKVKKGVLHANLSFDQQTCPFTTLAGQVWVDLHTPLIVQGIQLELKRLALYEHSLSFPLRAAGVDLAPAMFVGPTGDIGLGTTIPGDTLHVQGVFGPFENGGLTVENEEIGGAALALVNPEGSARLIANNGLLFIQQPIGSIRVTVDSSGKVGIGTTNPESPLDVRGPFSGDIARFVNSTNTDAITLGTTGDNESFVSVGSNDDLLLFSGTVSGVSEALRIQAVTGNVGIGTNSPTATLDVNGTAKIANWQDQVLGAPGHARIGSLLFQWGTASTPSGENTYPVSFPVQFSEVFQVVAVADQCSGSNETWVQVCSVVPTGFNVIVNWSGTGANSSSQTRWIAIGM
jgi:hypothetical protein